MNALESLLREHIRGSREAVAEAVRRIDALEDLTEKLAKRPPAPMDQVRANGWSDEEDEIIRQYYPGGGPAACIPFLRHRTALAIRTHARRLGVVSNPNMQRFWCDQCQSKVNRNQVAACQSKFCQGKKLVAAGDA